MTVTPFHMRGNKLNWLFPCFLFCLFLPRHWRIVHLSAAPDLTIQSQFTDRWIVLKGIVIELCDELHLHTLEQLSFSLYLSLSQPLLYCSLWGCTIACLVLMGSLQSRLDPEMSLNVILHHQTACHIYIYSPIYSNTSSDFSEDVFHMIWHRCSLIHSPL